MSGEQFDIFGDAHARPAAPAGFLNAPELISADTDSALLEQIRTLPFPDLEFQGYPGKRRVVSFGRRDDFETRDWVQVVIGVPLRATCTFRLRRARPDGWDRYTITAEPRLSTCCATRHAPNGSTASQAPTHSAIRSRFAACCMPETPAERQQHESG